MIIQIRGTSGSGKTWVMRKVMERLPPMEPQYVHGRKQPWYYIAGKVAILGHYESTCGGCDNIGSAGNVFELIQYIPPELHILCEGLLLSEDTKWSSQLGDLRVVYLTTPVDQCVEQIKKRRIDAGNTKPLNEENTRKRVRTVERSREKLTAAGVNCIRCSSKQAPDIICKWLGIK